MIDEPAITLIYEYSDEPITAASLTETRLAWLRERRRAADHYARATETRSISPQSELGLFSGTCGDSRAGERSKRT